MGGEADTSALSEEQLSFMQTCELEFKNRYSDLDPEYEQTKGIGQPPNVEPWYNKPRRNFDWTNRRNDRNDSRGGRHRQYASRSQDGRHDRGYRRY